MSSALMAPADMAGPRRGTIRSADLGTVRSADDRGVRQDTYQMLCTDGTAVTRPDVMPPIVVLPSGKLNPAHRRAALRPWHPAGQPGSAGRTHGW